MRKIARSIFLLHRLKYHDQSRGIRVTFITLLF